MTIRKNVLVIGIIGFHLALLPTIARAGIFKCVVNKKIIYSEEPCKDIKESRNLELVDNSTDSRALRNELRVNGLNAPYESSNEVIEHMSSYDLQLRVRELVVSIKAASTQEKINASRTELSVITSKNPRKLNFDDETKRSNLRRDLGSIQQSIRARAENNLYEIYNKY